MVKTNPTIQQPKQSSTNKKSLAFWRTYGNAIISTVLLISGLLLQYLVQAPFFTGWVIPVWYTFAYLPVGLPVLFSAIRGLRKGSLFNEFFLMSIATIGAFIIGEYPEGVAVMLFYTVGELFQHNAVHRAKHNIQKLLDVRPQKATVLSDNQWKDVAPKEVKIGQRLQVKVGEQIPIDGKLLSPKARVNTAALTGESKPQTLHSGDTILAGSINLEQVIELEASKHFEDSSIARILDLVQNASNRKAKTELLIRRLAKIYTPVVVYAALAIFILPYFFVSDYNWSEWLYRALVFLVISCPCALVISIPLGYFGGLGAASRNGLLFKGATFLDRLNEVDTVVFDKTGTLTEGKFVINERRDFNRDTSEQKKSFDWWPFLLAIEQGSNHPIAAAIRAYPYDGATLNAESVKEIAGKGLHGMVAGREVLAGNRKLLQQFQVPIPEDLPAVAETQVFVAIDGNLTGYLIIADQLKRDVKATIQQLRKRGIKGLHLLSGDNVAIVAKVSGILGLDSARGALLPEDKLSELEKIKAGTIGKTVFIGDGINDAPVLTASDIGVAMGGLGSDIAIEAADIVIQTDQPSRLVTGMQIAASTKKIIWQNIFLAFGVKAIVLLLGAFGMASMWAAVFADVGVALLAILNAIRLQNMTWKN